MTSAPAVDGPADWREELAHAFGGLVTEATTEAGLVGSLTGSVIADVAMYTVCGGPQVIRRTRQAIREEPADPLKMCLQTSGQAIIHQGDREVVVEPGQLALYDTGKPYDLRLDGEWSCAVLAVPRASLDLPSRLLRGSMDHALSAGDGPGAVLAGFVTSAAAAGATMAGSSASRVAEAGVHLLAGALSDGYVAQEGAGDARRLEVLAYVRRHLHDHELTARSVAEAHHMSPRTLHRLFGDDAMTVTEYIREHRLLAAHRDLSDAARSDHSVASIAARWCFVDQAHFTRTFKARFGTTPGAIRTAHPH